MGTVRKARKKVKKGFKKLTKKVGRGIKKIGKVADKATGGFVGKALKKTGLGKLGQKMINAMPTRLAARALRGDNLKGLAKDHLGGIVASNVMKAGGVGGALRLAKRLKGKEKKQVSAGVGAPGKQLGESFDTGVDFSKKVLGKDGMGRLRGRKDIEEIMAMKKKRATEGIDARSQEALRSKLAQGMQEGAYKAGLQSGAAMGGLKGGAADAQQAAMQANLMGKQANIARDIFLDAEKAKVAGEKDFSEATSKAASYDIDAMRQEKALKGQFGMGFEQMASADRQAALGAKAAQAQAPQKSGGLLGGVMDALGF